MPNKIIFRVVLCSLFLFSPQSWAQGQGHGALQVPNSACDSETSVAEKLPYAMSDRIQSAQEIINNINEFKKLTRGFHARAHQLIAESRRLKGEAEMMQTKTPTLPHAAKLSAAQYQEAAKQYNADLNAFKEHARAYDAHLRNFQATIGECHANNKALESLLKQYELHVDQFHLPELSHFLRPPHVCGRLQRQVGDLSQEANAMYVDQQRIFAAQLGLAKTEGELQNAEMDATAQRKKAETEAKRESGEQALAAEFSQLKGEYDLLKVEKDTLAGNSSVGKVTTSSVSASVKKNR
jgi:hypothetical protein